MKVLIIGAGLGGLTAAVGFAKRGHDVHVLERSNKLSPRGGGMAIRPGANRILLSWGLRSDLAEIADEMTTTLFRDVATGAITMRNIVHEVSEYPDLGTTRHEVMETMYRLALDSGALIHFGIQVVDVGDNASQASVKLRDGRTLTADMVLAADGVRSKIRSKILGGLNSPTEPVLGATTLYGTEVPAANLQKTRLTSDANISTWMGKGGFVTTRLNRRLGTVVLLYAINGQTDQRSLWDEDGDIDFVRDFFSEACEDLKAALRAAETCDRWRIAEMPNLPTWSSRSGRILLLGDSAHAMHPNAGQGYSQIVEDIGVLDFLLHQAADPAAEVPHAAEIWEKLRKPRAERVKELSAWNTKLFTGTPLVPTTDNDKGNWKSLKNTLPDKDASFSSSRFVKWLLDHDAVEEVRSLPPTSPLIAEN